ncbi:hypothetical protein GCM10007389_23310 [Pontibacter akesuensis]|nr:hypothetical protein GCM10007389_23310 [Pontibacter akesuensis]
MLLHVILLVLAILALNWQDKAVAGNDVRKPDLKESIVRETSERQEPACCLQKATHIAALKQEASLGFASFLVGEPLLRKKQPCQKTIALRRIAVS